MVVSAAVVMAAAVVADGSSAEAVDGSPEVAAVTGEAVVTGEAAAERSSK